MIKLPLLRALAIGLPALFFCLASHAESVDETRPISATGALSVSNVAGMVNITTWDRDEMRVVGEVEEDVSTLTVSGDASHVVVEVRSIKKGSERGSADLDIRVPAGVKVDVDAVSADVSIEGIHGVLKVSSVSGDVNLQTSSPEVTASTVSGDLHLSAPSTRTTASSVSGDLRVTGVSGTLKLETVSGDVQLKAGPVTTANLKSVSGDLITDLAVTSEGRVVAESLSGDIVVTVPASTSALVTLHSFSGDVGSDFAGPRKRSSGDEDEDERGKDSTTSLEFKINDAKGRIDLSSFSGDVAVRKR